MIPRANTILTVIALVAVGFILSFRRRNKALAPLPLPPQEVPLLGYLPFPSTYLQTLWLGIKLYFVKSSLALAREILRDQEATFANRDPSVYKIMSNARLDTYYGLRGKETRKTEGSRQKFRGAVDVGKLALFGPDQCRNGDFEGRDPWRRSGRELRVRFPEDGNRTLGGRGHPNVSGFSPALSCLNLQGVERQAKRVLSMVQEFSRLCHRSRMLKFGI